jgi:ABC-2 type transport system ATP-binding protein
MQQKAQLIATCVHAPDLIVVDEPFSGLDPVSTRLVKSVMVEQRQVGKTIVMSTHQLYHVEALCNRIVLIHRGRSALYGDMEQIKRGFAGNAVAIAGQGDFGQLSSIPGVLEVRQPPEGDVRDNGAWHLALAPGTDPWDVFRKIILPEDGQRAFDASLAQDIELVHPNGLEAGPGNWPSASIAPRPTMPTTLR